MQKLLLAPHCLSLIVILFNCSLKFHFLQDDFVFQSDW